MDSVRYFTTSVPNSGIFLPLNRASKRSSPTISSDSFPPTPTTPSLRGFNVSQNDAVGHNAYTPPTPSLPKFSQSVGPGRAPSPHFKPRARPSLPRPESPLRKNQNSLVNPSTRPSVAGQTPGVKVAVSRYAPSPTPGRFGASFRGKRDSTGNTYSGDPGKKLAFTPKASGKGPGPPRSTSATENHQDLDEVDNDTTPIGVARTNDGSIAAFDLKTQRGSSHSDEEFERLKEKLQERDKQLKEQASSLAEMENSFAELQSLMGANSDGGARGSRGSGNEDMDASSLRALLREKNEKIAMLTAEFDAHRADFRSTIDTLEMASTETERVYEKRVEDLLEEVRELQGRGEDVESVARQLKQLEELVQELEEGLEDARRGEAEARGEVEFLRGEVERGRSELRREREKAAAALKGAAGAVDGAAGAGGAKEVEQRDDEIRGLKAIIHSLSRDAVPDLITTGMDVTGRRSSQRNSQNSKSNGAVQRRSAELEEERNAKEKLARNVKELEGLIERKSYREEELEREIERLRKGGSAPERASAGTLGSNGISERTLTQSKRSSGRDSKGTVVSWRENGQQPEGHRSGTLETMQETSDTYSSDADGSILWCEICETSGHDILTCTNMFGNQVPDEQQKSPHMNKSSPHIQRTGKDAVVEGLKGLSVPAPHAEDKVAPLSPGKKSPVVSPAVKVQPLPHPMPNPSDTGMIPGKSTGIVDPEKWCALCERDGHDSVDCPFEDAF